MTHQDYALTALCLYREARGEGAAGMLAVACVLRNRVARRSSSYYAEVVRPWQFSSMTAKGDPQLGVFPAETDVAWRLAQQIVGEVLDGGAPDITNGATLYYDDSITFPANWNRNAVKPLGKVGRLNLFAEVRIAPVKGAT